MRNDRAIIREQLAWSTSLLLVLSGYFGTTFACQPPPPQAAFSRSAPYHSVPSAGSYSSSNSHGTLYALPPPHGSYGQEPPPPPPPPPSESSASSLGSYRNPDSSFVHRPAPPPPFEPYPGYVPPPPPPPGEAENSIHAGELASYSHDNPHQPPSYRSVQLPLDLQYLGRASSGVPAADDSRYGVNQQPFAIPPPTPPPPGIPLPAPAASDRLNPGTSAADAAAVLENSIVEPAYNPAQFVAPPPPQHLQQQPEQQAVSYEPAQSNETPAAPRKPKPPALVPNRHLERAACSTLRSLDDFVRCTRPLPAVSTNAAASFCSFEEGTACRFDTLSPRLTITRLPPTLSSEFSRFTARPDVPNGAFLYSIAERPTSQEIVIATSITCQHGNGVLHFSYWLSDAAEVDFKVCTQDYQARSCTQPIVYNATSAVLVEVVHPNATAFDVEIVVSNIMHPLLFAIDSIDYKADLCEDAKHQFVKPGKGGKAGYGDVDMLSSSGGYQLGAGTHSNSGAAANAAAPPAVASRGEDSDAEDDYGPSQPLALSSTDDDDSELSEDSAVETDGGESEEEEEEQEEGITEFVGNAKVKREEQQFQVNAAYEDHEVDISASPDIRSSNSLDNTKSSRSSLFFGDAHAAKAPPPPPPRDPFHGISMRKPGFEEDDTSPPAAAPKPASRRLHIRRMTSTSPCDLLSCDFDAGDMCQYENMRNTNGSFGPWSLGRKANLRKGFIKKHAGIKEDGGFIYVGVPEKNLTSKSSSSSSSARSSPAVPREFVLESAAYEIADGSGSGVLTFDVYRRANDVTLKICFDSPTSCPYTIPLLASEVYRKDGEAVTVPANSTKTFFVATQKRRFAWLAIDNIRFTFHGNGGCRNKE